LESAVARPAYSIKFPSRILGFPFRLTVKESDGKLDSELSDIRDLLKIAIDVIVQCRRAGGRFRVTEIYFDPHQDSDANG